MPSSYKEIADTFHNCRDVTQASLGRAGEQSTQNGAPEVANVPLGALLNSLMVTKLSKQWFLSLISFLAAATCSRGPNSPTNLGAKFSKINDIHKSSRYDIFNLLSSLEPSIYTFLTPI